MIQTAYRIVEIKNGKVMSLFHGTNGSREIPLDTWVKANKKPVKDGSCSVEYTSGFHVFKTKEEAEDFFNTMFKIKENRYVIPCYVIGGLRPKHERTRKPSYLVDYIYISKNDIDRILSISPINIVIENELYEQEVKRIASAYGINPDLL